MKYYLIPIILIFLKTQSICQCSPPVFTTQEQIDNFETDYPGCTYIAGNLNISSSTITNLEGLAPVTGVSNNIIIENNPELLSLSGLGNIGSTLGLSIVNNPLLTDLSELNLQGNLSYAVGIVNNANLTNLDGLEGIAYIGYLTIQDNPALTNINGLSGLNSLAYLTIQNNDILTSLSGLEGITDISFAITISGNYALADISGLGNLDHYLSFDLFNNNQLSQCAIQAICNDLSSGSPTIYPSNNAPGCNDTEEIALSCVSSLSTVSGIISIDLNCNDIQDDNDSNIPYHLVLEAGSQLPFVTTDFTGQYHRYLAPNSSFSFSAQPITGYTAYPNSLEIVTDASLQAFSGMDFRFCPDSLFHNLSVVLADYSSPRPGFTNQYEICVENTGTYIENGLLTFDFSGLAGDEVLTIVNSSGGTVTGNTITWNLNEISLFEQQCFSVTTLVSPTTPIGTFLYPHAQISLVPETIIETTLSDNFDNLVQQVVGSYDPNNKTVNLPLAEFSPVNEPTTLEYLIRFQNTGNYPATFIEILDTLEEDLDIKTIKMLAASHPYVLSFPGDRILKWRFNNINLPDSTTDEPESHGFVKFSIQTVPNLPLTQTVNNTAAIFFDYNTPIITNTATTSFYVGQNEINSNTSLSLNVTPNPADNLVEIHYNTMTPGNSLIELINVQGTIIKHFYTGHQEAGRHATPIQVSDIPAGAYWVKVVMPQAAGTVQFLRF